MGHRDGLRGPGEPPHTADRMRETQRAAVCRWRAVALAMAVLPGCTDPGSPPRLAEPGPQVAVVGQELVVLVVASDSDGDALDYAVSSPTLAGLADAAAVLVTPDGRALFIWSPLASDLGDHMIELAVTDGSHEARVPMPVQVRGAAGEGSQPVFVEPRGEVLVHDLAADPCVPTLSIAVTDPDDADILLRQQAPIIAGSELMAAPGGLQGQWNWCPDASQRAEGGIHELVVAADDGDNPPTRKRFSVWLQRAGADCPSQPPLLEHVPMDVETLADPELVASASDDLELPSAPIVFWSTEDVPLEQMETVFMVRVAGDGKNGTYAVTLPNPAVPLGPGATASLHYRIAVGDADGCFTRSPADEPYELRVTNPGGAGAGPCEPCSYDAQCGDEDDLCLQLGVDQRACGQACSGPQDCSAGLVCSPDELVSVEGASGRQCIPEVGACHVSTCEDDDDSEPNDDLAQVLAGPAIPEGLLTDRRLCPLDEDWYRVQLGQRTRIRALLSGTTPEPDLALSLIDGDGVVQTTAATPGSVEELDSACLPPGSYVLRVSTPQDGTGDYQLSYVLDANDC
jgi:hypothetical protein